MTQQRHKIKQQILELNISSDLKSFELQNRISALYRSQIIPLIEAYCNQLSNTDCIHRIDSLEIDLGTIEIDNLEIDFVQKVAENLYEQLSQKLVNHPSNSIDENNSSGIISITQQTKSSQPIDPIEANFELLQYFLKMGTLPWWSEKLNRKELESLVADSIAKSPQKTKSLLQNSLKRETIARRILYQFSEPMLMNLLEFIAPTWYPIVCAYLKDINLLTPHVECWQGISPRQLRQTVWHGILLQLSLNSSTDTIVQGNLFYVAAQFEIDARSLFEQLQVAIQNLTRARVDFVSQLPQILKKISQKEMSFVMSLENEVFDKIEQLIKNLVDLKRLNNESPKSFLSQSNIDSLLSQLNHFSWKNTDRAPSLQARLNPILEEALALTTSITKREKLSPIERNITAVETIVRDSKEIFRKAARTDKTPKTKIFEFKTPQNSSSSPIETEDIYIQNSGLILLYPFLNNFFETLGLVELGQFWSPQTAQRSVLLLQYLIDSSVESLEHLLPLNKILCGIDLTEPVPAYLAISEIEKDECNVLLSATIQNWSALKNTSIEGFRQAFLQRSGILRPHHGNWLLQVERQTYDILLDRLPWSIRVIKLPWMEQVLYTEW